MTTRFLSALILGVVAITTSSQADQIIMQNGDHYNGTVLSITTNTLVLQSEILGHINLSRGKIAGIAFGTNVVEVTGQNAVASMSPIKNRVNNPDSSTQLKQLASQTNLIHQVQGEFLVTATPEANAKFNQMLNDLSTGKMSMNDLRAQAKDAADQLRELTKDSGDDDTGLMSMYLSILDGFLNETTPANATPTNTATTSLRK